MEDEIKKKSQALALSESKIVKMEEAFQSDIDQLNSDVNHFKKLYEDLAKSVKSNQRYFCLNKPIF